MAYIGNDPSTIRQGRRAVYEFTATNGQTDFLGTDDNGLSLDLLQAVETDVYLNGSRLVLTDDYTISGDTLTLTSGAALNDIIVIVTQGEVQNAASYTKAEADARYINYDGDIVNGNIQVVGDIDVQDLTASGTVTAAKLAIGTNNAPTDSDISLSGNAVIGGQNSLNLTTGSNGFVVRTGASDASAGYSDGVTAFRVQDGGDVSFFDTSANAKFFWDASAESLGIGTTSPLAGTLAGITVFGSTNGGISLQNSTSSSLISQNGQDVYFDISRGTATPGTLIFRRGSGLAESMRITSGGNVGIGTTSPSERLTVSGKAVAGGYGAGYSISTRIGQSSDGASSAEVDMRRWTGSGTNHGTGRIATSDAGTMLFYTDAKSTDTFATTERMRIDSTGNVGIDTNLSGILSGASGNLYVGGVTANQPDNNSLLVSGTKGGFAGYGGLTTGQLHVFDDTTNTAGSGGAISFGADCGSNQKTWLAAIESFRDSANAGNYGGGVKFWTRPNGAVPVERMRITSGGNVGIGTTSPLDKLEVEFSGSNPINNVLTVGSNTKGLWVTTGNNSNDMAGIYMGSGGGTHFSGITSNRTNVGSHWGTHLSFYVHANNTSSLQTATERMRISGDGSIGAPSGSNIYNPSDQRLKQNISTLTNALETVSNIRGVSYNWKDGFCPDEKDKTMYGFVAQEIQQVDKNIVEDFAGGQEIKLSESETVTDPLRVNEKFIVPLLVEAIKELTARIEELENR